MKSCAECAAVAAGRSGTYLCVDCAEHCRCRFDFPHGHRLTGYEHTPIQHGSTHIPDIPPDPTGHARTCGCEACYYRRVCLDELEPRVKFVRFARTITCSGCKAKMTQKGDSQCTRCVTYGRRNKSR